MLSPTGCRLRGSILFHRGFSVVVLYCSGRSNLSAFIISFNFFWGESKISNKKLQINEEVRDKEVGLIGADGEQLGVMPTRQAMEMAVGGDIIVLAGKGHETYQEIMGVKRPFDEKVVVQELLEEMNATTHTTEG